MLLSLQYYNWFVIASQCGSESRIRTDGLTALQAVALDHSAISLQFWRPSRESNPGRQFWRLKCYRNT